MKKLRQKEKEQEATIDSLKSKLNEVDSLKDKLREKRQMEIKYDGRHLFMHYERS